MELATGNDECGEAMWNIEELDQAEGKELAHRSKNWETGQREGR